MNRSALPAGVGRVLRAFERRILGLLLLFGGGRIVRLLAVLLLTLYGLDRLFEPPPLFRLLLSALALVAMAIAARNHLLRPLRERPGKNDLAALLERTHPGLEDRLATAVEIERIHPGESPALKQAAAHEAELWIQGVDLKVAAPAGAARRSAVQGLIAALLLVACGVVWPTEARTFFDRLFGGDSNWPRRTTLVLLPPFAAHSADPLQLEMVGPERFRLLVAQGTPLTLRVRAVGDLPDRIAALGPLGERPMQPLGGGEFLLRLPPLEKEELWSFRGGDDDDGLPSLKLEAGIAPAVMDWWVQTTPPSYTGRNPERSSASELRVPVGSQITFGFSSDLPVQNAALRGLDGSLIPLEADEEGHWQSSLIATDSGEIRVELVGIDGFRNAQAAVLRWHAEADRAPRVDFLFPDQRWLGVPGGQVPVTVVAADDYGLEQVRLHAGDQNAALDFTPGLTEWQHHEAWELPAPSAEDLSMEYRLRLEAEVVDGAEPDPQRSTAQAPWVQVVPPAVFEEDLAGQMVRLRERVEEQLARLQELQDGTTKQTPVGLTRRLDRDLGGMLQDLEHLLLERIYAGLDRGAAPVRERLGGLLDHGAPAPGQLTEALGRPGTPPLLDRSALLLDLARAARLTRQGPVEELRQAAQKGLDLTPAAKETELQLRAMLDILLSWEDFQSAVDLLRGLLDRQRTLYLRTQEASAR